MTARQQPAPGAMQADNKQLSLRAGELELPAHAYLPAVAGVHQAIHVARQLERGTADAGKPIRLSQHNVLQLQRTVGNRAVVRLLHPAGPPLQREGGGNDDKGKEPAGKAKDRTEEFRSSLGPLPEDDKVELEAIIMAFGVYERSGRDPAQARTLDTFLKRFVTQRYVDYGAVGLMPTLMAWSTTVAREAGLTPAAGKAEASQSWAGAVWGALSSELPDLAGAVGWGARSAEIRAVRWMLNQLASVGFNVHDQKNVVVDQLNNMGGALLFGTPADLYVPYMTVTKLGHQFALNRILVQGLTFEWSLRQQRGMNLRIKRIDIDNATIRAIETPGSKDAGWSADVNGNIHLKDFDLNRITTLPNLLYSGLDTFVQGLTWRLARVPYAPLKAEVLQIGDVTATLSGKVVMPGGLGQMGLGGAGGSTTLGVSHVAVDPKQARWAAAAKTAVTVTSGASAFDISDIDLNVDERGDGRVVIALNLAAHMISGFPVGWANS